MVEFATPGIDHVRVDAGCDRVPFDRERAGFGQETVKSAPRHFEAARLPAIVRVPSEEHQLIARTADTGGEAIGLLPVDDTARASSIFACLEYAPRGRLGVALGIARDARSGGPVPEKRARADERTTLCRRIGTAAGVEDAFEIAVLGGADCLWVGHFDLSAALGIPGEFRHPTFLEAIERKARACREYGKACGRLVPDVATGLDHRRRGFDRLRCSGEVWAPRAVVRAGVEGIRAGIRAAEPARPEPAPAEPERRRGKSWKSRGEDRPWPVTGWP